MSKGNNGKRKRLRAATETAEATEVARSSVRMKKLEAPDRAAEESLAVGFDPGSADGDSSSLIQAIPAPNGRVTLRDGLRLNSYSLGRGRLEFVNLDDVALPSEQPDTGDGTDQMLRYMGLFSQPLRESLRTVISTPTNDEPSLAFRASSADLRAQPVSFRFPVGYLGGEQMERRVSADVTEPEATTAVDQVTQEQSQRITRIQNLLQGLLQDRAREGYFIQRIRRDMEVEELPLSLAGDFSHRRLRTAGSTTLDLTIRVNDPRRMPVGVADELVAQDTTLLRAIAAHLVGEGWGQVEAVEPFHDNESYLLVVTFRAGAFYVKQFDMRGVLVISHAYQMEQRGVSAPRQACLQAKVDHLERMMRYAR